MRFQGLRFGTLSLFATMLLVVSGGGWWKFHRDLYVEETEVLSALKKEAQAVAFTRPAPDEVVSAHSPRFEPGIPWDAPWSDPVATIWVFGDASESTRARALALPRLRQYSEEEPLPGPRPIPRSFEPERLLGRPLPAFPEPTLDPESLQRSLPDGEELGGVDAAEIAESIRLAWQRERPAHPKRLVAEKTAAFFAGTTKVMNVAILEEDRTLTFASEEDRPPLVRISDDLQLDEYSFDGAWRRKSRVNWLDPIESGEARRGYLTEDYPYLGVDFRGASLVSSELLKKRRFEVDRVAKIDDLRYRVDFKSFHVPEKPRPLRRGFEAKVVSWSCVLRSDLDWAPEEMRLTEDLFSPHLPDDAGPARPPQRYERRLAQRFERRGKHVLLVERVSEDVQFLTRPIVRKVRTLVATEFDPAYDEAAFDPRTLDPKVWPDRRRLPFWRWYRVTFAVSLSLFAFLIGRSVIGIFGRLRRSTGSADKAPSAERPETGEKAEAPTPGS